MSGEHLTLFTVFFLGGAGISIHHEMRQNRVTDFFYFETRSCVYSRHGARFLYFVSLFFLCPLSIANSSATLCQKII